MDAKENYKEGQYLTKPDDGSIDDLKKNLEFTEPVLDSGIYFIPQTRMPLLSDTITLDKGSFSIQKASTHHDPSRPVSTADTKMVRAQIAIEAKALELGWANKAVSEVDQTGPGYVIRFESGDIYYSVITGAHEVRGEIRAKYNAFGAANGILGLPETDESGTPDKIGKFNHFQGGSIYWTPDTGPMVVRGVNRDMWAAQGWENSTFGYPIADQFTKTGSSPEYWSGFQNGAIYSNNNIPAAALIAEIAPQDLASLVRKTFDKALKAANSDLGIEGGVNILNVSNWGYGFWESKKRMITYEIHGFYSIPELPDPTFRLVLQFQFGLIWRKDNFTEPKASNCDPLRTVLNNLESKLAKIEKYISEPEKGEQNPPKPKIRAAWTELNARVESARQSLRECDASNTTGALTLSRVDKTLVIYLRYWKISASGILNQILLKKLTDGILQKFPFAVRTIPADTLLTEILVTPQGGLNFLLAPGQFGKIRLDAFQTALNNFIES